MLPLFDMLNHAQNGAAMQALAQQFSLTQQQTQAAVQALLPAFSQGLKRNAADPYGFGSFLGAMSSGHYAKYFEDAGRAASPAGVAEGNDVLGHLFGSKELSRAVAAQAAQATGIGQEIMRQMLPVIAAMIMGGLAKQSAGQINAGAGNNPLADMMAEMMRQSGAMMGGAMMGGVPPSQPAPQPSPFDNPFGRMMEGMFGGAARQPAPPPQNPYADNPMGRMFEEMFGGRTREPEQPKQPTNPSGRERSPYDDLFGQMFESGAKQRDEYQKNMESIFDQFLKGMDRHR